MCYSAIAYFNWNFRSTLPRYSYPFIYKFQLKLTVRAIYWAGWEPPRHIVAETPGHRSCQTLPLSLTQVLESHLSISPLASFST